MPGRGIAIFLMIAGIALFGVLTATIAAYFVKTETEGPTLQDLEKRLERIEGLLERRE